MRLSDACEDIQGSMIIDGAFEELSFLGRERKGALVPVYDSRYINQAIESDGVACIVTTPEISQSNVILKGCFVSNDPLETFLDIHQTLLKRSFYWKREGTYIADTARVHPRAYIEESDVYIGEGCIIEANAVILAGTTINHNSVIGPNVTVGYDGFEVRNYKGSIQCIPHGGGVLIGPNVDIQANSSIARSVFNAPTIINEGCKLGHQVFISHGVILDRGCRVGAHATISGSSKVGEESWIGPNATISNGITLGKNSFVSIGAVVVSDVSEGSRVSGNFAIDHMKFLRKIMN